MVIDENIGPVADVEITITPKRMIDKTNNEGAALFVIDPGEYFMDADVCCIGPGFIKYHVPVKVMSDDTVKAQLNACLTCL
jgi:hypothetical protein